MRKKYKTRKWNTIAVKKYHRQDSLEDEEKERERGGREELQEGEEEERESDSITVFPSEHSHSSLVRENHK